MLRNVLAWLVDTVRGLACPFGCGYRGHDLAAHVDVDHCGDDHILTSRPSRPADMTRHGSGTRSARGGS